VAQVDHGEHADEEDFGVDNAAGERGLRCVRCDSRDEGDEGRAVVGRNDRQENDGAGGLRGESGSYAELAYMMVDGSCDSTDTLVVSTCPDEHRTPRRTHDKIRLMSLSARLDPVLLLNSPRRMQLVMTTWVRVQTAGCGSAAATAYSRDALTQQMLTITEPCTGSALIDTITANRLTMLCVSTVAPRVRRQKVTPRAPVPALDVSDNSLRTARRT
jgi:hypothetical protein